MPADRFFVPTHFQKAEMVDISGDEHHHLARVTRTREGQSVDLVNGNGQLAAARVVSLKPKLASAIIESVTEHTPPKFKIILAQALPRANRLDFILEKGTELGVAEFWLFPGDRSERETLSPNQIQRLERLAIAAMKQCGSLFLPQIVLKPPLIEWPPVLFQAYFGDLGPKAPLFVHALTSHPPSDGAVIFIGPESGFTDEEIELLRKRKALGVNFHSHILRTDTAPLVAVALLHHLVVQASTTPR